MSQSKLNSLLEQLSRVATNSILSFTVYYLVYPGESPLKYGLVTVWMIIQSIMAGYFWRRVFNKMVGYFWRRVFNKKEYLGGS